MTKTFSLRTTILLPLCLLFGIFLKAQTYQPVVTEATTSSSLYGIDEFVYEDMFNGKPRYHASNNVEKKIYWESNQWNIALVWQPFPHIPVDITLFFIHASDTPLPPCEEWTPVYSASFNPILTFRSGCSPVNCTPPTPIIGVVETSGTNHNDGIICAGDLITLNASGGTTYAWSTGETTASIMYPLQYTTTYTVTVTTTLGCTASATKTIDVNPNPSSYLTTNPSDFCINSTITLTLPSAGAGASYTWSGNGVVNANSNTTTYSTPSTPGQQSFSVSVLAANGCRLNIWSIVTVYGTPSATITPSPNPVCQNGTLNLSVPNAGNGASYNWEGLGIANNNNNATTALPTTTGTKSYAVTVTNQHGCSASNNTNVTVNPQPSAQVTPSPNSACQNSTLNLSVPSAGTGTTYNWVGNGIANNNTNTTTAVPTLAGTQLYTVTVTNSSGCVNTGTINVTVLSQPAATITLSQSGTCGPALINLSVPSAGVGASYNWAGVGIANNNTNTTTANPNSGGSLNYMVTVTNAQGCSKTGSSIILINTCIEGRIIWKQNNTSGVKDVTVALSGSQTASAITPLNGTYNFNFSNGGNVVITPSKYPNKLNGVNAQDVSRIQQHLSGIPITDPYQLVAADVNADNTVNSLDASIIQLSLMGNASALAQFASAWRFVPTSHSMTTPPWGFPEKITIANAGSGLSNQNFYGIKVGDLAATYANPANAGGNPMVFRIQDQWLKAGQEVSIDFTADQLAELTAFQLALRFDPNQMRLTNIQSLTALPLSTDNFGVQEDGLIRVLWAGTEAVALRAPSPVFRLTFTALESGSKLSDVLGLDNSILPAHVYNSINAESDLSLRFFEVTGTNDPALTHDGLELYQNQPNPFSGETSIGFYLPEAAKTVFTVYDVNGKLVYRQDLNGNKGHNQLTLQVQTLPNAGLFYYRIETATGPATRKMVKVE